MEPKDACHTGDSFKFIIENIELVLMEGHEPETFAS